VGLQISVVRHAVLYGWWWALYLSPDHIWLVSASEVERLAASFERLPRGRLADRMEAIQRTIAAAQAGGQVTADEARGLLDYLKSLMEVLHPAGFSAPYLHLRRLIAFSPPLGSEGKWVQAQVRAALDGATQSPAEKEVLSKALAERMAAQLFGVFGPPAVEVPLILPRLRPGEVDIVLSYREWRALEHLESITMFQHGLTGRRPGARYLTVDFHKGPDEDGARSYFQIELSDKGMTG